MSKKTGSFNPCIICGTPVWRTPSDVKRNIRQTCSKACLSKRMSGEGNPFWGKGHPPEMRLKLQEMRRANLKPRTGPPKGYKHTPEAKQKMSEALKERWLKRRDFMMEVVAKASITQKLNRTEEPRYRKNFTPFQRKEWKSDKCAWCASTQELHLDHILPVMAGGTNDRTNAQTLCRTCNLWKMHYVDKPITLSILGSKGG